MIYIPSASFAVTAYVLRTEELAHNLNEAREIIVKGADPEEWEGYTEALILFSTYLGLEYRFRGKPKKAYTFYNGRLANLRLARKPYRRTTQLPHWLGSDWLHAESRQALVRLDRKWYQAKFKEVGLG